MGSGTRTGETGTVEFGPQTDTSTMSSIVVRARHPNRAKVRVRVMRGDDILSQDIRDISVPQFFHIRSDLFIGLDDALVDLGLRRTPPDFGVLTEEQRITNDRVKGAVLDEMLDTARSACISVNVRFTSSDPTPCVGTDNFAIVTLHGLHPQLTRTGEADHPTTGPNAGKLDVGNLDPTNSTRIYAQAFTVRESSVVGDDIYAAIFDGLAIRDNSEDPPVPPFRRPSGCWRFC